MPVKVFKTRWFRRYARKENITETQLLKAVAQAEDGLIDADLGAGVIKQRIARPGGGKSGGFRTVILYRRGKKAFFVYGFAKKELGKIRKDELRAFRELAGEMLNYDEKLLQKALESGAILEVRNDEPETENQ